MQVRQVHDWCSGEAVFARCLSSLKSERVEASQVLNGPAAAAACYDGDRKQMVEDIKQVMKIHQYQSFKSWTVIAALILYS